jgi:hypothetical protein
MLIAAVCFFLIAAFLGTFLLRSILKNKRTYKPIVFMHGSVAGLALLILVTYVALGHTAPLLIACVVLFVLAALGGLTMFTLDTTGKRRPKMLAIGHPIIAVSSIILLIIYIVQSA